MDGPSTSVAPFEPPATTPMIDAVEESLIVSDVETHEASASRKRKFDEVGDDDADDERSKSDGNAQPSSSSTPVPAPLPPVPRKARPSREFFFEDGNIILLVRDTFFKVHRSRLTSDNSIFGTMLSLPAENAPTAEGMSFHRPIEFDDRPRRFASLLWALYALPAELRSINSSADNCKKLIDIATAAHKFGFQTTEEWAVSCLVDLVKTSNRIGSHHIDPWRVFILAQLCSSIELRDAMVGKIVSMSGRPNGLSYSWMITIGESLQIEELIGEGYYNIVIKPPETWNEDPKLTEEMKRKLFVGFCKLVTFKDQLFSAPFEIVSHNCALTSSQCRARWTLLSKENVESVEVPSVDVLGHMRAFKSFLNRNRSYPGPCHGAWIATLDAKIRDLSNGKRLVEFFK